ncbi:hypothetical protein LUZ60_010523 [Juncus effusus]|nr:hypothetical protein LUZ60_010523 [Juncus effusus]
MATRRTLSLKEEEEEEEVVLITHQSDIYSEYESHIEEGMREICADLLGLKEVILNQSDTSCYEAFLRLSHAAKNVNKEVFELQNNCSSYKSLFQDLANCYYRQLDFLKELYTEEKIENKGPQLDELLNLDNEQPIVAFLQNLDILILEHKTEEALSMLLNKKEHSENSFPEINKRKEMLVNQLVAKTEQPYKFFSEIKKYLDGLIKLGNESLAHKLFLKSFTSQLQQKNKSFIQFSSFYPNTYTLTLSQLVFSTILQAINESFSMFGEKEGYRSNFTKWAESEIENFVRVVKQNAPSQETLNALHSAAICIQDILDQFTPMAILYFRPIIMRKTHQLFNKFIDELIKSFPPNQSKINFNSQLLTQQILLMNSIFAICDEFLPISISKMLPNQGEIKQKETESTKKENINSEFRNWRRHIQRSCNKLRDHFCWQFVLSFIYTREGKTRSSAKMYLELEEEYSLEDSEWIPSSPFRALFARFQQLESLISEIVAGKEKVQKSILSRTVETVLMWLLNEKEFWELIQDNTIQFHQNGLQQHILDMHFIIEIAIFGGYSTRNIHQLVSAIITKTIEAFSARGVDPQSALYEDEWFSHAAKAAILKLAMPISSNSYEFHDNNYNVNMFSNDNILDSSDNTSLSLSDEEFVDSFSSANNVKFDKSDDFTSTES